MSRLKDIVLEVGLIGQDTEGPEPRGISRIRNSAAYYEGAKKAAEIMEDAGLDFSMVCSTCKRIRLRPQIAASSFERLQKP